MGSARIPLFHHTDEETRLMEVGGLSAHGYINQALYLPHVVVWSYTSTVVLVGYRLPNLLHNHLGVDAFP